MSDKNMETNFVKTTWHLSKRAALAVWGAIALGVALLLAISFLALVGVGMVYWQIVDPDAGAHALLAVVVSALAFVIVVAMRPKVAREPYSHDYVGYKKQAAGVMSEGTKYTLGPANGGAGDLCIDFMSEGARRAFLANGVLVHKGGSTGVDFAHITFGGARVGEFGLVIHCKTAGGAVHE